MKILALSDRPPSRSILQMIAEERPDLICTLGDLYHLDILELGQITDIPKVGVYGNHCSGTYMEPLGITNMHLQTMEFAGMRFGGFQGCVRYKNDPSAIMHSQEEAQELLKAFPPVDVFISHAPPFGINDEPDDVTHQGFLALREYIDRTPPKYWLHGHTYPQSPLPEYNGTKIKYVFGEKVISF